MADKLPSSPALARPPSQGRQARVVSYLADLHKTLILALQKAASSVNAIIDEQAEGEESGTPDANGNLTVAHGLPVTPDVVLVGIKGDTTNHADVESVDATNITVRIKDSAGADVTAGTQTFYWWAKVT